MGNSSVMRRRRLGGRCQRAIRRCLWANGGTGSTREILAWAYPHTPAGRDRRERKNRARAVTLAARKMAVAWQDVARRHSLEAERGGRAGADPNPSNRRAKNRT